MSGADWGVEELSETVKEANVRRAVLFREAYAKLVKEHRIDVDCDWGLGKELIDIDHGYYLGMLDID